MEAGGGSHARGADRYALRLASLHHSLSVSPVVDCGSPVAASPTCSPLTLSLSLLPLYNGSILGWRSLARHICCDCRAAASKIEGLQEELQELLAMPCPLPSDLTLEGLCKWAPEQVVEKVRSALDLPPLSSLRSSSLPVPAYRRAFCRSLCRLLQQSRPSTRQTAPRCSGWARTGRSRC